MEMSQRIHFWYQILLKMLIFLENGQKNKRKQNKTKQKQKKTNNNKKQQQQQQQNKTKQNKKKHPSFLVKNFCDKLKK